MSLCDEEQATIHFFVPFGPYRVPMAVLFLRAPGSPILLNWCTGKNVLESNQSLGRNHWNKKCHFAQCFGLSIFWIRFAMCNHKLRNWFRIGFAWRWIFPAAFGVGFIEGRCTIKWIQCSTSTHSTREWYERGLPYSLRTLLDSCSKTSIIATETAR